MEFLNFRDFHGNYQFSPIFTKNAKGAKPRPPGPPAGARLGPRFIYYWSGAHAESFRNTIRFISKPLTCIVCPWCSNPFKNLVKMNNSTVWHCATSSPARSGSWRPRWIPRGAPFKNIDFGSYKLSLDFSRFLTHLVLWNSEDVLGHDGTPNIRALKTSIDCVVVAAGVVVGDDRAWLHGVCCHAVDNEVLLHDVGGVV